MLKKCLTCNLKKIKHVLILLCSFELVKRDKTVFDLPLCNRTENMAQTISDYLPKTEILNN